jgi:hypothetical protein
VCGTDVITQALEKYCTRTQNALMGNGDGEAKANWTQNDLAHSKRNA